MDFRVRRVIGGAQRFWRVFEARDACGKTGAKLRCGNCKELTYVPFRCGTRICEACAKRQADKLYFEVRRKLRRLKNTTDFRLRHVVLTLKGSGEWSRNGIDWALSTLARSLPTYYRDYLRRAPLTKAERAGFGLTDRDLVADLSFWRKRPVLKDLRCHSVTKNGKERFLDLTGLVVAFEVGPSGNVHAHCLYYGPFRRQEEMSAVWQKITGDSFVVWVRLIENRDKAVREVTKYVVKLSEFDDGRLLDLYQALEPYRRVRTYGAFLGIRKEVVKPGCWSCGVSGNWKVLEWPIPEERWKAEYADWERYKSTAGKGHAA